MLAKIMSGLLLGSTLLCGCAAPVDPPQDENVGEAVAAYTVSNSYWWLPPRGGSGGSGPDQLICDYYGDVIAGFYGTADQNYIHGLGLICAHLNYDGTIGATYAGSRWYGGSGGSPFTAPCPAGTVANVLVGRAGAYLNELSMQCTKAPSFSPYYGGTVGIGGGPGGNPFYDPCPYDASGWSGAVLSGINVRHGAYVDQIQGQCAWIAR